MQNNSRVVSSNPAPAKSEFAPRLSSESLVRCGGHFISTQQPREIVGRGLFRNSGVNYGHMPPRFAIDRASAVWIADASLQFCPSFVGVLLGLHFATLIVVSLPILSRCAL